MVLDVLSGDSGSDSSSSSRSSLDGESDLETDIVQELQSLPLRARRSEQPASYRHSMDEFYAHEAAIINTVEPPPYNSLLYAFPQRKFNIQPREDEGRETLPKYSTAISLQGVFSRKMELEGVVKKSADRNWYRVLVTLQGTALNIHRVKSNSLFSQEKGLKTSGKKDSTLIRSYNLQHADVGMAADYHKKRHVIRVRAETDQFLLSCSKLETHIQWLQSLNTAIDIAPPLDDRPLPRDLSIPRAHRRQLRRPPLTPATTPEPSSTSSASISPTPSSTQAPTATQSQAPNPRLLYNGAPSHSLARARRMLPASTEPRTAPSPNLTSDGKWHPHHHWTQFYDMMYAKRCMAVLTDKSPRKSNLVVVNGKLWVVDWCTGALMDVETWDSAMGSVNGEVGPPGYAESTLSTSSERGSF